VTDGAAAPAGIDTTVSHSARIWNYWLGGKDNFAVDREAGSGACSQWRPDASPFGPPDPVDEFCGVARKP
jgi:hypothetical protein